jgi:hypothetical protein
MVLYVFKLCNYDRSFYGGKVLFLYVLGTINCTLALSSSGYGVFEGFRQLSINLMKICFKYMKHVMQKYINDRNIHVMEITSTVIC